MKNNSIGLIIVSTIIASMSGCSLEGKSCIYSDVKENNEYHCKDRNTSESCQTDGLWGQEETCSLGCDETSGRCIGSFNCDDCQLGCTPAGTACANCNANKCANGQLRLCKADKSGYEENATECSLGCNPEGTDCAICTNKCENGKLSICKADKSGFEENSIDCVLGCNIEGTACKQCESNKCENGSLKKCKDDQSDYEDGGECVKGCNAEGTNCDNSCTTDVCKDGTIYRCNSGMLAPNGDKCPDLGENVTGSCANANKCKQCDDSIIQLRRFCASPTDYYICKDGLWSEYTIQCTNNQICDDKTDTCIPLITDKCINNNAGAGQLVTMLNDELQVKECPGTVSCNEDGTECGDCFDGTAKCENDVYYICNHGKYQESTCSLGLGCRSDENGNGICIECTTEQCQNDSSNIGILKTCTNGTYDEGNQCKANGVLVSCHSETECGVCKDGTTKCSNSTLQTCTDGQWLLASCAYGCFDTDQICNICVPGYKECEGTKLKTCAGGGYNYTTCKFQCYTDTTGARCIEECIPGLTECVYSNNAKKCSQDGKWEYINCPGGCYKNICQQ